jgi:hypothetical protein
VFPDNFKAHTTQLLSLLITFFVCRSVESSCSECFLYDVCVAVHSCGDGAVELDRSSLNGHLRRFFGFHKFVAGRQHDASVCFVFYSSKCLFPY